MLHKNIIQYLQKESVEHVIIVKNDKILADFVGNKRKVSLPNNKLYLLENAILYHNHIKSSTFSFSDVSNLVLYKAEKMYLVTEFFLYSIKRPQKIEWNLEINKLEKMVGMLDTLANEEIERLVIKENMDLKMASLEKSHYIWLYISTIYEFEYSRKIIK